MKRNNFSEEQADKRLSSQPMTNEERAARATVVISNEEIQEDLVEKVCGWVDGGWTCCVCVAMYRISSTGMMNW